MNWIELPKESTAPKKTEDLVVFSTRVRYARNVEGLKFPTCMKTAEREMLESRFFDIIPKLPGETAHYDVELLTRSELMAFLSGQILTHDYLRNGRVFVLEQQGDWVLQINEDDHFRLFGLDYGYHPSKIYHRLTHVLDALENEIDFAFQEEYGYLTSSILNVGSGLRFSVLLNLYGLVSLKRIEQLIDAANKTGYSLVQNGSSDSPFFILYNLYSLGLDDASMLADFESMVSKTVELELAARKEHFERPGEHQLAYEELFDFEKKDAVDFDGMLYYLALADALNIHHSGKPSWPLRKLFFQTSDEYLQYRQQVDASEVGKARISIFRRAMKEKPARKVHAH